MKEYLFAMAIVFASCLSSCGEKQRVSKIYDVEAKKVSDYQAALFIPGLNQEELLKVWDTSQTVMPGDRLQVYFNEDGSIASYKTIPCKETPGVIARAPGGFVDCSILFHPQAEKLPNDNFEGWRKLELAGSVIFPDLTYGALSQVYSTPFLSKNVYLSYQTTLQKGGCERRDYTYCTYYSRNDSFPKSVVWSEEIGVGDSIYVYDSTYTADSVGELLGVSAPYECAENYRKIYGGLPFLTMNFGFPIVSGGGAEPLLRVFKGPEERSFIVSTLRGASALFRYSHDVENTVL